MKRKTAPNRKNISAHRRNRNNDSRYNKSIILTEKTIYKPLGIMFALFLFFQIILFPTSVFDNIFPEVMSFLRRMFELTIYSGIATLFTFPVSLLDVRLVSIYSNIENSLTYMAVATGWAVLSDTTFAVLGYVFANKLMTIFLSKKDREKNHTKMKGFLDKYGFWGMFIAAATPFPFTIAIYYAGAMKIDKRKFIVSTVLGRLTKYVSIGGFLVLFGVNIIDFFSNLIDSLF